MPVGSIDPLGQNIALAAAARNRRFVESATGGRSRALGGPAPDPAWDAFFGSIDTKADEANGSGQRFSADMVGRGPGTGIGTLQTYGLPTTVAAGNNGGDMAGAGDPDYFRNKNRAANAPGMTDNLDYYTRAASLKALDAQARIRGDQADEADWQNDPYFQRQQTGQALEREGAIQDFGRQQAVKNAANTADVYEAGGAARDAASYDERQDMREKFPYSKEGVGIQEHQIDADAKRREAVTNQAREQSAALRALADMAKTRSGMPSQVPDPTGATEGGVFGFGARPRMVPNPGYDDVGDSMGIAQRVIQGDQQGVPGPGGAQPAAGGKSISVQDLTDFARQNSMSLADAQSLAKQHGWTVR